MLNMQSVRTKFLATIAGAALLLGCSDKEIKTYRVAKEAKSPLPAPGGEAGHGAALDPHGGGAAAGPSLPHVHGQTPAGWEERALERMRVVSFQIAGDGGRQAQMAIIPMPGASGIELQSINMWREELGLQPLNEEQFKTEPKSIEVGNLKAHLFEMSGAAPRPNEDFKRSTLGAVFERNGMLWFAKLTGESTLVGQQKENFQSYLKSLEFHDEAHGAAAPATAASGKPAGGTAAQAPTGGSAEAGTPAWTKPANWKDKAPGPMLTAAYAVESSGGQADVTISRLSGDGGGMAPNVNRWRGQLGLSPAAEAELQKSITTLEIGGGKGAYLADIKGTNVRTSKPARMIAIGVPAGGQTWFYKLMGDEAVVEKEKDALLKFVTSAH